MLLMNWILTFIETLFQAWDISFEYDDFAKHDGSNVIMSPCLHCPGGNEWTRHVQLFWLARVYLTELSQVLLWILIIWPGFSKIFNVYCCCWKSFWADYAVLGTVFDKSGIAVQEFFNGAKCGCNLGQFAPQFG